MMQNIPHNNSVTLTEEYSKSKPSERYPFLEYAINHTMVQVNATLHNCRVNYHYCSTVVQTIWTTAVIVTITNHTMIYIEEPYMSMTAM